MKHFLYSFALALCCLKAQLPALDHQAPTCQYQAVVFDFGGVVAKADRAPMVAFLTASFGISESELKSALKEMQTSVAQGESETDFWHKYAQAKGRNLPADWASQFNTVIKMSINEIPGTIALVKALQNQGYQTAMLSDVTQYQAQVVEKLGYYNHFNPLLLSYKIGVEKPDPRAFEVLLATLKLPAATVIFIDDKPENVAAAQKMGIEGIIFINPDQLREALETRGVKF